MATRPAFPPYSYTYSYTLISLFSSRFVFSPSDTADRRENAWRNTAQKRLGIGTRGGGGLDEQAEAAIAVTAGSHFFNPHPSSVPSALIADGRCDSTLL